MKPMFLIFKNNTERLFEIVGVSKNDTKFTEIVSNLQSTKQTISCGTEYISKTSIDEIIAYYKSINYSYQSGLFIQLSDKDFFI